LKPSTGTSESRQADSGRKQRWWQIARIAGTLLLLFLLFELIPAGKIWEGVRRVPVTTLAAIVIVFLLIQLVSAFKWYLMVNYTEKALSFAGCVQSYFAGLFSTTLLPTLVGTDAVAMTVGMNYSSSKLPVIVGTLVNRILDFAALVLLVAAGVSLMPAQLNPQERLAYEIVLVLFLISMAFLTAFLTGFWVFRLSFRWRRRLVRVRRSLATFFKFPVRMLFVFVITIAVQLAFIGIAVWIGNVCGLHLSAGHWIFAWPLTKLIALIPVTIGGLGARELGFTSLTAPFGVDPALAVSVSLVFSCVVFISNVLAGAASVLVRKFSRGRK
jgi:uncharacterized protein (TIRG00374 family)